MGIVVDLCMYINLEMVDDIELAADHIHIYHNNDVLYIDVQIYVENVPDLCLHDAQCLDVAHTAGQSDVHRIPVIIG